MTNAKKHKTKTKNGTFNNDMYCTTVMGIYVMFCQSLNLQFSDSLLQAVFELFNCNEWFSCKDK